MPDVQQPYVQSTAYLPVRAVVRGQHVEGRVLGWRGSRVYLQWRTRMGNHLGWVPAEDVDAPVAGL